MIIPILAFGIAKEVVHGSKLNFELPSDNATVDVLRSRLSEAFPDLKRLASYMVAINDEYAYDDQEIKAGDEVAIIPPVSGG